MNAIVAQIAKSTGLDPALVEKGLGILLSFVKSQDPERFGKIIDSLPGAAEWMGSGGKPTGKDGEADAASESAGGGGGLLGSLIGMLGGGGGKAGDAASLLGGLRQAGFTADSAAEFLPHALKSIQEQAPAGALDDFAVPGIPSLADFLKPVTGPEGNEGQGNSL